MDLLSSTLVERPSLNFDDRDSDGHLILTRHSILLDRYEVIDEEPIGCGTFGQVFKVQDLRSQLKMAMKVSLRERKNGTGEVLRCAAREVDILKELNSLSTKNMGLVVKMFDSFELAGRNFLFMELLDLSVYDFIATNNYQPFPTEHATIMSYQLLSAVNFLHCHNYIHTDIKPENIALVCGDYNNVPNPNFNQNDNDDDDEYKFDDDQQASSPFLKGRYSNERIENFRILKRTDIRIIDFGSTINLNNRKASRAGKIGTREYRAPESILQLRFHFPLDVWAVGCTLFDLWKGFTLFEGVRGNNVSHLLRMEIILHGPLPQRFLDASPSDFIRDRESFYSNGYCDLKTSSNRFSYFQSHPTRLLNHFNQNSELEMQAFNLIHSKLLQYEPVSRLTAAEALQHPLFKHMKF